MATATSTSDRPGDAAARPGQPASRGCDRSSTRIAPTTHPATRSALGVRTAFAGRSTVIASRAVAPSVGWPVLVARHIRIQIIPTEGQYSLLLHQARQTCRFGPMDAGSKMLRAPMATINTTVGATRDETASRCATRLRSVPAATAAGGLPRRWNPSINLPPAEPGPGPVQLVSFCPAGDRTGPVRRMFTARRHERGRDPATKGIGRDRGDNHDRHPPVHVHDGPG